MDHKVRSSHNYMLKMKNELEKYKTKTNNLSKTTKVKTEKQKKAN